MDAEQDTIPGESRSIGRGEQLIALARSPHAADRVFWALLLPAFAVYYVIGRRQWFVRDDWAFIFTRNQMRTSMGADDWLLFPQDGHWMTGPILVYRAIQNTFGIDSYWPYLIVLLATHVGLVLLVRTLCRRVGASAWITTLTCAVLLVFGTGWENMVFAIQITYNFSLLAFLAQVLLVDHDGPADRRDWIGSAFAMIGVSSSGFGPFFILGLAVLLVIRRRWIPALIAVAPQGLLWGGWWLIWGADPAGSESGSTIRSTLQFLRIGVINTFGGFSGFSVLAGTAALAAGVIVLWTGIDQRQRTMLITLWVVTLAMFAGVGLQRSGFGVETSSRYHYMAAMVIAPALALALDQAHRFAPWAAAVPRILLVLAVWRNTSILVERADNWADLTQQERRVFALLAGTDIDDQLAPSHIVTAFSPDVRASDIDTLVAEGAVVPTTPISDADRAAIDRAINLPQP